jgi:hypothetical protein
MEKCSKVVHQKRWFFRRAKVTAARHQRISRQIGIFCQYGPREMYNIFWKYSESAGGFQGRRIIVCHRPGFIEMFVVQPKG